MRESTGPGHGDHVQHGLGPTRARVLGVLQDAGEPLTAAAVAEQLGLHVNSARFHLEALAAAGTVERSTEERSGPGRPRLLYAAAPTAPDVGDRRYRLLAAMLGEMLHDHVPQPALVAEQVGRSWAGELPLRTARTTDEGGHHPRHAVEPSDGLATLVGTLGTVGFDSALADDAEGPHLEIRHCPFLEVAADHQDVVCPIHLGLMRGVLERTGSSVAVTALQPLVEPHLCRARLAG